MLPIESGHFHIPTKKCIIFSFSFLQKLQNGSCFILILNRKVFVVNLKWLILYCNHWNLQFFVVLKGNLSICLISFSVNSNIVINFCLLVGWKLMVITQYCIHISGALFAFQKHFYIPMYIWVLNFWNIISFKLFGVFF